MNEENTVETAPKTVKRSTPTRFFLKGLAISLPPVLTLVILIWVGSLVNNYIIHPTSTMVRYTIAKLFVDRSVPTDPRKFVEWDKLPPLDFTRRPYRITPEFRQELQKKFIESKKKDPIFPDQIPVDWVRFQLRSSEDEPQVFVPFGDRSVPFEDYETVSEKLLPNDMPRTSTGLYMELVTIRYFKRELMLSAVAVSIAIVILYFIGRLVTARLGMWFVQKMETSFLGRVPLVGQIYGSVKQVTDFVFSERTVEYNRVVAVEYPRRGLWSLGFVTSEGLLEIAAAAGEPLVSVLMPTSPMPMTGFTIHVARSEILDLNITIDQAFQYCLSCGVLVPSHQKVTPELLQEELAKRFQNDRIPLKSGIMTTKPSSSVPSESPHRPTESDSNGGLE